MAKAKKKPKAQKKPMTKSKNPWANKGRGNNTSHTGPSGGTPKSNRPERRQGF
jgi:hypothetical protein